MEVTSRSSIKIPGEISPVPNMESMDDESFVVLGSGFDDSIDYSYLQKSLTSQPRDDSEILEKIKQDTAGKPSSSQINSTECLAKLPSLHGDQQNNDSIVSQGLPPFGLENKNQQQPDDVLISLRSATASMNSLTLEDKNKLLQENMRLKETILQNNQCMKMHFKMIEKYQEDVKKTFQVNKEKFTELREFAENLKIENFALKEKLQSLNKKNESGCEQNCRSSQEENAPTSLPTVNKYEFELHLLSEENQKMKREIENFRKLECDNEILRQEIENLKTINEENIQIKKENVQLVSLSKTTVSTMEYDTLKQRNLEQSDLITKLNEEFAQHKISSLTIQKKLIAEKNNLMSELKRMAVAQEEVENLRQQLVSAQQLITKSEMSEREKQLKIINLQDEIARLKENEDAFYAIKTQLDVYKSDFEAEHESRETISKERNQIAEDLRNVQKRNQELQDEVNSLRGRVFPGRRSTPSSGASHSSPSQQPQKYECPKCSFNFNTLDALQNHVERCLDLDDALP